MGLLVWSLDTKFCIDIDSPMYVLQIKYNNRNNHCTETFIDGRLKQICTHSEIGEITKYSHTKKLSVKFGV